MESFTLEDMREDPILKKMFLDPLEQPWDDDPFGKTISVEEEASIREVWEPIFVSSRDQQKRDSLIKVLETVILEDDKHEWDVEPYNRQQVVLDEVGLSVPISSSVEDIKFPEVGAERLMMKKLPALSYVDSGVVVAARNNDNILTHCVPFDVREREAVVFQMKFFGKEWQGYFWHGRKIRLCQSKVPLWLGVTDDYVYNRTNGYCEDESWVTTTYLSPGFDKDRSYYVWVNGLAYVLANQHVFVLRSQGGVLCDKNGTCYGHFDNEDGNYLVAFPTCEILGQVDRGPDSAQVIKSTLAASVTTREFLARFPALYGERAPSVDLNVYVRSYPDTRVLGFQLIGRSHALIKYKIKNHEESNVTKVVVGHTIYPAYIEPSQLIRVKGKVYDKQRVYKCDDYVVIMSNKLGVPMGVWFQR